MIRHTCFLLLFLSSIVSAYEEVPGLLPEQILSLEDYLYPPCGRNDAAECISYRFPKAPRVDLSFVTFTRGENACDLYWQMVSELRNDDLFRFLNRGAALLAEDFGTPNVLDWKDMMPQGFDPFLDEKSPMPQGFDRIRQTIKLQRSELTYTKLPFIAYRARTASMGAVSSDAAMIPELLGVVDKKHWLLGRKMLDCQFVVDVLYVMTLEPPLFRHRLSIGIAPYCGDRRVRRDKWQHYPIKAERAQKWRRSLSKRIVDMYRNTRREDPFLRIMGFNMISEVGEKDQSIGSDISPCPMP